MVKILALSDVYRWEGCDRLFDQCKPDIVALAGDLTSDGGAAFRHDALELIPKFRSERHALYERAKRIKRRRCKKCPICANPRSPYKVWGFERHMEFLFFDHMRQLEAHYRKTKAFAAVQREIHVEKFYAFLKYAGRRAVVLVVKGDHDDDFPGAYDVCRINRIPGCHEISGGTYRARGELFLGVSYQYTAYRRISLSLLEQFPHKGGIVIAHARQRNVPLLADLAPKLIIRGHFGFGQHRIGGVPAVFTSGGHAIIDIAKAGVPRIRQPSPVTRIHQSPEPHNIEPF
jgi:hypothetical protein